MLRSSLKFSIGSEWKAVAASALLLLVSACSGKSDNETAHKTAGAPAAASPTAADLSPKIVPESELAVFKQAPLASNYDPYAAVIVPLRKSFFNLPILLNPQLYGSQRDQLLEAYNQAVRALAKQAATDANQRARLKEVLEEYERFVTYGCQDRVGCRLVESFRDVSTSWDVWNLVVEQDTADLARKEKRLRFAWLLVNGRATRANDLRYLELAPRLEAILDAAPDRAREEVHYNRIERILRNSQTIRQTPEFAAYLRQLLESRGFSDRPGRRQRVRQFVMLAGADTQVLREKWFLDGQRARNANDPVTYEERLRLATSYGTQVLTNFQVRAHSGDDFLVVLDNVYSYAWTPSTAYELWSKAKPTSAESARLFTVLQDYVRTMIIAMTMESNQHMGKFYNDRELFESGEIHTKAYEASQHLRGRWLDLYSRMARLREFASLAFGATSEEVRSLRLDQSALNEAASYLYSFPQMLVMAYQMVKHKFTIAGMFSKTDYTAIIGYVFEGRLGESWFDIRVKLPGEIGLPRAFNATEMLYAVHFALKSETFAALGMDAADFIRVVTRELIFEKTGDLRQQYHSGLHTITESWLAPRITYAAAWEQMLRFCRDERELDRLRAVDPGRAQSFQRGYQVNVSFEKVFGSFIDSSDLGQLLFSSGSFSNFSTINYDHPLFDRLGPLTQTRLEHFERVRYSLGERVNYVKDIYEVYRHYLVATVKGKDAEAEIEARLKVAGEAIADLDHHLRRFYTIFYSTMREFVFPCYGYIFRKEFDHQNQVILYEYEHLKQVYRDYHRLKAIAQAHPGVALDTIPSAQAVLARYRVAGYEKEGYTGFDNFLLAEGIFEGYRLDATLRFRNYMIRGLKTDTVNLPPINPQLRIELARGRFLNRVDDFHKSKTPYQMDVSRAKNEEEFARQNIKAMRSLDGNRGALFAGFHQDAAGTWSNNYFSQLVPFLAAMVKLGEVEIYSPGQPHCMNTTRQANCKIERTRVKPDEITGAMFEMYSLFGGTDFDHKIMDLLGIRQRGKISSYQSSGNIEFFYSFGSEYLFHPKTRVPMGFFDTLYMLTTNTRLGFSARLPWSDSSTGAYSSPEPNLAPLNRGKQLFDVLSGANLLILPADPQVSDYFVKAYAQRIEREFAGPHLVEKLARDTEARDKAAGFERKYRVQHRQGNFVGGLYLEERLISDQAGVEAKYHKDMRFLFKNGKLPEEDEK